MKRIITLAAIILALVACKKDETPSISVNPATAIANPEGETVNANISASGAWTASCATEGILISPSSAAGDSPVSISIPKNATGSSRDITVTFSCTKGGNSTSITISQNFYEEPVSLEVKGYKKSNWDFDGGIEKLTVECNYPWEANADEGLTVEPKSGSKGTTEVTVTILPNTGKEPIENMSVRFQAKGKSASYTYSISAPYLTYGDVEYPLVKLKDGNIWMAANLRYIPEGKTASNDLTAIDNGLWYPLKVNEDNTIGFDESADGIAAKGYLYTTNTAFGVAREEITEENAASFEGCQGICPEGWHLPTVTEIVNLVGKCTGMDTKTDAPYYDPALKNGEASIALLEADNWPVSSTMAGMIQMNKLDDTAGKFAGFSGTSYNMGYFIGSSFYKKTTSNIQFYGLMPFVNNATINGAYLNMTNGVSIRCVKDKAQE